MFADQVRLGQPLCCNAFYTHFCIIYMFADQARLGSTLCCNAFHTHFSIIYMFDDQVRLGQALCCNAFYNHIRLWGSFFTIGGHHNIRYPPRKYFRFSTKNLGQKTPTFLTIEEIWVLRKSKIIQTGLVLISVLYFYHWWSPQYQVPTEKILVATAICDTQRDNILGCIDFSPRFLPLVVTTILGAHQENICGHHNM